MSDTICGTSVLGACDITPCCTTLTKVIGFTAGLYRQLQTERVKQMLVIGEVDTRLSDLVHDSSIVNLRHACDSVIPNQLSS